MKTPKEIFDKRYEFYRNIENKPPIPLEARELIFNVMQEYASQKGETDDLRSELIKFIETAINPPLIDDGMDIFGEMDVDEYLTLNKNL